MILDQPPGTGIAWLTTASPAIRLFLRAPAATSAMPDPRSLGVADRVEAVVVADQPDLSPCIGLYQHADLLNAPFGIAPPRMVQPDGIESSRLLFPFSACP